MSFVVKEILALFNTVIFYGDSETVIDNVIAFNDAFDANAKNKLSWVSDKFLEQNAIPNIKIGLLVCSETTYQKLKKERCNFLVTENPRAAFVKIISEKFKKTRPAKIEPTAVIHPSAKIGTNCYIGHHVVIEENCMIGNNCSVLHNTVLLADCIIGNNVTIGCNNTIGNYGFGYEKDETGDYQKFEHLGNVVIHDHVEIHNNTCIDRGVLGSTVIYENVKIDNLVHIAHGVIIGRNSLIIANALIGGSAVIGENSWVAPSATIKNKVTIGNNNMIGMGAVVLKNTADHVTMIGNPAQTMEAYLNKKKQQ